MTKKNNHTILNTKILKFHGTSIFGRDTTINKEITEKEACQMYTDCMTSLSKIEILNDKDINIEDEIISESDYIFDIVKNLKNTEEKEEYLYLKDKLPEEVDNLIKLLNVKWRERVNNLSGFIMNNEI